MHYIDVKDVMEVLKGSEYPGTDQSNAYLSIDDQPFHVKITYQKTGFGEKPFLCCPKCGSRRVKLYLYAEGYYAGNAFRIRFIAALHTQRKVDTNT